ncbi:hypothetical protein FOA52_004374 [Chlamydomonas sp. UWO 241]|nr:hypothetical protein FOA52_004374 [Chlamydomonas sp. UWO 241]
MSSGGNAPRQPLAKSVPARPALPALAGVFPDVFVVRWELSAAIKTFGRHAYADQFDEYKQDQIRSQHNMKVIGSLEDVYGTVAAANAAANAQFDNFRLSELLGAKQRALLATAKDSDYEDADDDKDEDGDAVEFTEFTESTGADGAACWRWEFAWEEQDERHDLDHLVAYKGSVRVVRARVLAKAGNSDLVAHTAAAATQL